MLNRTKIAVAMMVAGTALSPVARAQTGVLAPSDPTSNFYRVLVQNSGGTGAYINCDNSTGKCSYEVPTLINMKVLQMIETASGITQQRYATILDNTKADLHELVKSIFAEDGLVTLANRKVTRQNTVGSIQMSDLYASYAAYQEKYQIVENDFNVLASFFDGDDMSIPIEDQAVIKEIPTKAPGTIEPLKKVFWSALKNVNKTICRQTYNIAYPNDTVGYNVYALNCDTKAMEGEDTDPNKTRIAALNVKWDGMQFDKATIDGLLAKIREYRRPTEGVTREVQKIGDITAQMIKTFVQIFGVNQRTENRLWSATNCSWWPGGNSSLAQVNDIRIEQEEANYDNLITAFWARSALRFTTGLPVGAFDINYEQDPHNWDIFQTKADALSNIPPNVIFAQDITKDGNGNIVGDSAINMLQKASLKYAYALNTSESKSSIIANRDEGQTKDLVLGSRYSNLIDYGNSLSEVLDGKAEHWKALALVIKLMAADLYEEQVIRSPGGMKKMMKMYAQRYVKVSKEKRARYSELAKQFSNAIEGRPDPITDEDLTADTNAQDENTVKGRTMTLSQEITRWLAQINHARVYQVQLDFAYNMTNSVDAKKASKRSKML